MDADHAVKPAPIAENPRPIDPGVRIGHVHLKVADLNRALGFYCGVLGFSLMQRFGQQAAFISAGGYHHHIGLNTWDSLGGAAAAAGQHGAVSCGDPVSDPRGTGGCAAAADGGGYCVDRRVRSRRERGSVSGRSGRERGGAVLGSPAGGVAENLGWGISDDHAAAGSGRAARVRLTGRRDTDGLDILIHEPPRIEADIQQL